MSQFRSDHDFVSLGARAGSAAARLRRRLRLPSADAADLRQELLVDLSRRLNRFNPDRGCIGAFATVVLRNQSARIANRVYRERRAFGGPLLSLNMLVGSEPLIETLPDERDAALADAERRIDVARAVLRLAPADRALCAAVTRWPVDHLVERGFGSRAGLYRRLRELRCVLAAHGLRAA